MNSKVIMSFVAIPALLISIANGEVIRKVVFPTPANVVPCTIEEIYRKHEEAARTEATNFSKRKEQELIDPENRANRGANRLKHGDEFSLEGGMSYHKISLDMPQFTIRTEEKSFDFVEITFNETRIPLTEPYECWFKFGPIKTKSICFRKRDLVTRVPQFYRKRVVFSLPSSIEMKIKRVEFSYDLPTLTQRDNRQELNDAMTNIDRIKKEIEVGKASIAMRHNAEFVADVNASIDRAEADAMSSLAQMEADVPAPMIQKRAELNASLAQARHAAGDRAGEIEASYTSGFQALDQAEALIKAGVESARRNVREQISDLRSDFDKIRSTARACGANT